MEDANELLTAIDSSKPLLSFSSFITTKSAPNEKLRFYDEGNEKMREGQIFITMPSTLTTSLPGSSLLPDQFLSALSITKEAFPSANKLLLTEDASPIFSYTSSHCSYTVCFSSLHANARLISEVAHRAHMAGGFEHSIPFRASYQIAVQEIMEKVLRSGSQDYEIRIIEDCIASADTLTGVIGMLEQTVIGKTIKKIRIDVVCATTQGLLILKTFAEVNNLILDIYIGYLAYGLSVGEKKTEHDIPKHANYITYSVKIQQQYALDSLFVVGDMGDAFQSLPQEYDAQYPWNDLRVQDEHGPRGEKEKYYKNKEIDNTKPIICYLTNGGYFMRALFHHYYPNDQSNELVFSAKRAWSNQVMNGHILGYGVLMDNLPQLLLTE